MVDRHDDDRAIDVLCIGETMALVTPDRPEPVDSAESFRVEAGGAESNVACHLAAAGRAASWFGAVGDDALGRRVLRFLAIRGVDVSLARVDPEAPTGLYVKDPGSGVVYYRRGSAASRLGPADIAHLPWPQAHIAHLSGITLALSPTASDLVASAMEVAPSQGVLVSFDVNYRAALWESRSRAASAILEAARRADIVWVGRDEAALLWNAGNAQEIRGLLPTTTHLIVKDADVEATEFSGEDRVAVPTPRIAVVEAVGAGDAFAAGWIDAYLSGAPPAVRLARGHEFAGRALRSTSDVAPAGMATAGEEMRS